MKLNRKNKKAFTIVELVIVIGVIGILSAILIPTFANLTNKASAAALQSDLSNAYASYAADVADGYYNGDKGDAGATAMPQGDKMYAQNEVFLSTEATGDNAKAEGKYYKYVDGKWVTGSALGSLTAVYAGYKVLDKYYVYKA